MNSATVDFDLVVTVCDAAAEDRPLWLGQGRRAHYNFPDRAKATGTDEEIMQEFRNVRDAIERDIRQLLDQFA